MSAGGGCGGCGSTGIDLDVLARFAPDVASGLRNAPMLDIPKAPRPLDPGEPLPRPTLPDDPFRPWTPSEIECPATSESDFAACAQYCSTQPGDETCLRGCSWEAFEDGFCYLMASCQKCPDPEDGGIKIVLES